MFECILVHSFLLCGIFWLSFAFFTFNKEGKEFSHVTNA
jgi:hypothetical protein